MKPTNLWVWIDGSVCPADEAKVEVTDRGFLYGDSIYETLRTYDGAYFALEEHLDRLEASAAALRLELPKVGELSGRDGMREVLSQVAAARPQSCEAGARLTITRGSGPLGLDTTTCGEPRLVVFGWPIEPGRHPLRDEGVTIAITSVRRNPPNALNPHIKSGNFLNNIFAHQEARVRGAFEGVLLTQDGSVAECTTSNLFWVRAGVVRTAPDEGILLGVTRQKVVELLRAHEISHEIGSFPADDLRAADEVFITSSLKGVLAVREIDGNPVADGKPGSVTRRLADLYDDLVARESRR